ncbi:MAG: TniQ family protein, partial [Cyclobacteriaceae bacterium]
MIAYFPKPLPDEILYSLIARYGLHTHTTSYQPLMRDIYGIKSLETNIDLPGHMSLFSNSTKRVLSLNSEELINRYTLWPFYAHFIKKEKHKATIESIKKTGSKGIDLICGLRSSNIKRVKIPQYCPTCCLEDIDKFGEMYWHRKHQIPSILICSKHNCYLETAQLDGDLFTKKHQFINASFKT